MKMAPSAPNTYLAAWLIRPCKMLSTTRGLVVSSVVNILLSLLATWLFTARDTDYGKLPLQAIIFQYGPTALTVFLILALLYLCAWTIAQFPIAEPPAILQKHYLSRRIFDTQDLMIEGIPLIPPKVQLDEIFIPLQLRPHQLDIDQWLTLEQREQLRTGIRSGQVDPEAQRVLISAERQHERGLRDSKTVNMSELWQRLNREH